MSNNLYLVQVRVRPLSGCEMPNEIKEAIAICFASAPNYLTAVSNAVESLKEKRYEFLDVAGDVQEIDYRRWDKYVASVLPDFSAQLPSKKEVFNYVLKGAVFFWAILRLGERMRRSSPPKLLPHGVLRMPLTTSPVNPKQREDQTQEVGL